MLRTLVLSNNPGIKGALPASWGTGFPKIYDLNLEGLGLSGALPRMEHKELEHFDVRPDAVSLVCCFSGLLFDLRRSACSTSSWDLDATAAQAHRPASRLHDPHVQLLLLPVLQLVLKLVVHHLQVQDNQLDSTLPPNWPLEMPKLANLSLDGNKFQGEVPASWADWGSLQTVYAAPLSKLCKEGFPPS